MTVQKLIQATQEIAEYRDEIIKKLMQYSVTDVLLFWGADKGLMQKQQELWSPLLEWARDEFGTKFKVTQKLDVPEENRSSGYRMALFLKKLSDKELACFYLAALNMRSVLLAAALIKGRINAEQAFQAAYLEELHQAESWGVEDEAEAKRQERHEELKEIEGFLKS